MSTEDRLARLGLLHVDIDGVVGSLAVTAMAGSYLGAEAPQLRSLIRTLVEELKLPSDYVHELRAEARRDTSLDRERQK